MLPTGSSAKGGEDRFPGNVVRLQRKLEYATDWTSSYILFSAWVEGAGEVWNRIQPYFDDQLAPVLGTLDSVHKAGLLSANQAESAAKVLSWLMYDTQPIPYGKGKELDKDKKKILAEANSLRDAPLGPLVERLGTATRPFFSEFGDWQQLLPGFQVKRDEWRMLQVDLGKPLLGEGQYKGLEKRTATVEANFANATLAARKAREEKKRLKEAAQNPAFEAFLDEPTSVEEPPKLTESPKFDEPPKVKADEPLQVVESPLGEERSTADRLPEKSVSAKSPSKSAKYLPVTREIAQLLVVKNPPRQGIPFNKYLSSLELKKLGYSDPTKEEAGWLKAAWKASLGQSKDVSFKYDDSSTWVIKPIVFANDLAEDTITSGGDEQAKTLIANIRNGSAKGNTRLGGSVPAKASRNGERFHNHITNGSGGLSWAYVISNPESNEVTPYVYDIATKRDGNKYDWTCGGGKTAETSGASW